MVIIVHHDVSWEFRPLTYCGAYSVFGHTKRTFTDCSTNLSVLWHHDVQGSIDQVDGLLSFTAGSGQLVQWDLQIESVCHQLDEVLQHHPTKPTAIAPAGA